MDEEVSKNKLWDAYRNIGLTDAENIIKSNLNGCARNFVAIGFYLKDIRDNETYLKGGYDSIWAFALDKLQMSKSTVSRFMAINDRFSVDGNSPILMDKYLDYGSGKLQEMLTMTDEEIEKINPDTTVKEIRQIKRRRCDAQQTESEISEKEQKSPLGYTKSVYPPESLIASKGCGNKHDCFSCARICQIRQEDRYCVEAPMGHPFPCTTMKLLESIENDIGGDCMFLNLELAYHRVGDKEPVPCCKECKNKCSYACNKAAHAETVIEEQKSVNDTSIFTNGEDRPIVYERECANCNYNDMTPEEFKNIDPAGGLPCNDCDDKLNNWMPKIETVTREYDKDFPCDTCGYDINGCCDYDNEDMHCVCGDMWKPKKSEDADHVETVEADIIQNPSADQDDVEDVAEIIDPEKYTCQDIRDELNKLIEYVGMYRKNNDTAPGRRKAKMRLDAMVLLDEEMRKPPVIEEPEPVQPELPILKNNDQRKEWAENYKAWGEWYYDEKIDCHYYKYDFPNGDRLVVEEYRDREVYWNADKRDEKYYHLLIKEKKSYGNKYTYEEKFTHQTSSMSEIVEYLKEIQKKGV